MKTNPSSSNSSSTSTTTGKPPVIIHLETSQSMNALPSIPHTQPPQQQPESNLKTAACVQGVQVYEGSKFFWRQRLNCDINIFLHETLGNMELCFYDSDKSEELPRLYLTAKVLYQIIETEFQTKCIEKLNNLIARDKTKKGLKELPSDLQFNIRKELVTKFILDRLQPSIDKSTDPPSVSFAMVPLSGDTIDFATLEYHPLTTSSSTTRNASSEEGKVGELDAPTTTVRRRRKQTMADFNNSMESLRSDSMHLTEMCSRAQKLTALTEMAVGSFAALMRNNNSNASGKRRMKLSDCDKQKPLGRFKWAGVRILMMNSLEHVKNQLNQLEEKKKTQKVTSRMAGTFPSFESSNTNDIGRVLSPPNRESSRSMIVKTSTLPDADVTGTSKEESPKSISILSSSPNSTKFPMIDTNPTSLGKADTNHSSKSANAATLPKTSTTKKK